MNRTLLHMLRTQHEVYKSNWKDHVNKLIHTYNCTKHESTGFSPFLLLFGRPPRLHIDLMFNLTRKEESIGYPAYANKLKKAMQEAYTLPSKSAERAASKGPYRPDAIWQRDANFRTMTFNFNIFQCFSNIRNHLSNFSYLVCISCKFFIR
jgi:hypothetical protein